MLFRSSSLRSILACLRIYQHPDSAPVSVFNPTYFLAFEQVSAVFRVGHGDACDL